MRRPLLILAAPTALILAVSGATRAGAQGEDGDTISIPVATTHWTLGSVPTTGPITDGQVLFRVSLLDIPGRWNAELHWYSPRAVVRNFDLDPRLTDAQGARNERRVLALSVPRRPITSQPTDTLWVSLTGVLDPFGLDLTHTRALEFWVNDFRDEARVRGPGLRLHVDLGVVSEDQMRAPDQPPNRRLDTEDSSLDHALGPGEDTGVDGIDDSGDDGLSAPLDLVTANPLDLSGDTYRGPAPGYEEIDPRRWIGTNGTEGNRSIVPRPEDEDLNWNAHLDLAESYFEYTIELSDTSTRYRASDVYAEFAGTSVPFPPGPDNGWRRYRIPLDDQARVQFGLPDLALVRHVRFWVDGIVSPDGPDGPASSPRRPLLLLASTIPTPVRVDIGSGRPNPFASSTAFGYRLESPTRVHAVVLDLQGRTVDVLEDAEREPGDHEFEWDGRDTGGRVVPPGLYFVRARIAGRSDRHWRVVRLP